MILTLFEIDTLRVLASRRLCLQDYAKPFLLSLIIKANVHGTAKHKLPGNMAMKISIEAAS